MFSLIITVISVALVAALALATLYYGGDAYESGQAKAEAAKLRNQGQQLVAAAEFYYLQKGEWPETIDKMVESGHLSTVPVAQRTAIQEALAGKAWVMPVTRQPLFTFDEVTAEVCSTLNQDSYGLKGILPKLQPGYMHQCFGPTKNDLLVVVGRGSLPDLVAAVNEGLLVPENVSSDPIPDPGDTGAWTVSPVEEDSGGGAAPQPEQGSMTVSPSNLLFGSVATHFSVTREVTVSNGSGQAVSMEVPSLTGHSAFSIASTSCGSTLSAGNDCVVSVSYAPEVVSAEDTATLSIAEGFDIALSGSAYNPVSLQGAVLPPAKLNRTYNPVSFSDYLEVANESTPDTGQVAWEVQGTLPSGLSFDVQTGTLSGTPTQLTAQAGQDFTVLATYKNNQGQQVYTIRVGDAIVEATAFSTGHRHTCVVTTEGGAKCWGAGGSGQLGAGSTASSSTPVTPVGLSSGVQSVSAGGYMTCAVLADSSVKCWGVLFGNTPVTVPGLAGVPIQAVSTGEYFACGVSASGGVYCWGFNTDYQLGNAGPTTTTATPVGALSVGVVQIDAGAAHACARTNSGVAYCWGKGEHGRLGNASLSNTWTPSVPVGFDSGVSHISAGLEHSCGIKNGAAYCWGLGSHGRIGDGATSVRSSPRAVLNLTSGMSAITAGGRHSCAVSSAGNAYCWGNGTLGQIGNGLNSNQLGPVHIPTLSGVQSIMAGELHTCAKSAGGFKCWGDNSAGQQGVGATLINVPTLVQD